MKKNKILRAPRTKRISSAPIQSHTPQSMAPYTLEEGSTGNADLSDTQAFLSLLARLRAGGAANDEERDAASLFDFGREVVVARAPGRLDVSASSPAVAQLHARVLTRVSSVGGIADYSGSLVLQMPLAEACFAAAQAGPGDGLVRVVSLGADGHRSAAFSLPAGQLMDAAGAPAPYEAARTALAGSWAAYPLGAVHALCVESGKAHFAATGLRLLLSSAVPEGKGVSSSAAVEVASLFAAAAVAGTHVGGRTAALWCQLGENRVVGAACGVMDQMASSLGQPGALLALLCRPAEVQGVLQLGSHVAVWGLDSGVRHSVGGSDYGSVRAAAFMAKTAAQIGPGRHLTEARAARCDTSHTLCSDARLLHPPGCAARVGARPRAAAGGGDGGQGVCRRARPRPRRRSDCRPPRFPVPAARVVGPRGARALSCPHLRRAAGLFAGRRAARAARAAHAPVPRVILQGGARLRRHRPAGAAG